MIYWFSRLDKKEKATINPKVDDDTCFQYAATVALSYEKIKWNPERIFNIKLLIDKYNWQKINYPSKIDDWKTFEQNNPTIALNILHTKEKEIPPAYISDHNSTGKKQIILLMILNEEKEGWHYLEVKKLSALLRKYHYGGFYCLNYLHSFRTENKLMKKYVEDKYFCGIVIPSEKDKILEFKQSRKSNKLPYIIYAYVESLIRKIDGRENNSEKSSTTKIGEHIPCWYSMSTIWRFDHMEEKHMLLYFMLRQILHEKVLCILKRTPKKYNWFWKEKNVTINKKRIKITWRWKSMLYLQNKILKKSH